MPYWKIYRNDKRLKAIESYVLFHKMNSEIVDDSTDKFLKKNKI